jgi:superfamily II DNA or RNA helicase
MKLSVHHHKVFVDKATDEETRQLSKSLKVWYRDFRQELRSDNLFAYKEQSFPTGYLSTVLKKLHNKEIKVEVEDKRSFPQPHLFFSKKNELPSLFKWQSEALTTCEKEPAGIVSSLMGCHAKGTKILMFNGEIKNVENIQVNDLLMGPDSQPRKVLSLCRGKETMYKVIPTNGNHFTANKSHVLSLKKESKTNDQIFNMSIQNFLNLDLAIQKEYRLYRVGVDFQHKNKRLPIDPYLFGTKLATNRVNSLDVNYQIPHDYKTASRSNRKLIIAGILDTQVNSYDKNDDCFRIAHSSKIVSKDIAFIAQSLGLGCSISQSENEQQGFYLIKIFGNISIIPTKVALVPQLQVQKPDGLTTEFTLTKLDSDNYYGFELDGDHLYLIDDFTVTHNTGKSRLMLEIFHQKRVKTLIIVPTTTIQKQLYQDFSASIGKNQVSTRTPKSFGFQNNSFKFENENPAVKPTKKIGSSYSESLPESQKSPEKKKFGSSYSSDEPTSSPKKKIGSSYYEEQEKPNISPEEDYLSRKKSVEVYGKWSKKNLELKHKMREHKPKEFAVTILCFLSLKYLSKEFMDSVEMVMVDECHHANAISIRECLLFLKNAAYRYGFSATPWKDKYNESMLLIAALGEKIIYEKPAKEAVDEKLVARPRLEVREAPTPDVYLQKFKHWRTIYEHGIVGNKKRNQAIVSTAIEYIENGHNILICVDEISHLEILKARFEEKKVIPLIIHGQMKTSLKDQNIDTVSHADTGIISIATMAVGEGANLINVDIVMLAGGGKSSTRFLQRLGRGIRKTKTKDEMILLDFNDWFNPTLMRHSRERKKTFHKIFG